MITALYIFSTTMSCNSPLANVVCFTCTTQNKVYLILSYLILSYHMRGAVAERRLADFETPALLPQVCSHIRGADAGGSAISCGWRWFGACGFEADAENWVLDPFIAERILLPLRLRLRLRSATAYVWAHVVICIANFPPASTPRMCERTFLGQVMELWLFCYLVLLSSDSKTRLQDSGSFVTWPISPIQNDWDLTV